jgi:hypothetical protein
MAAQKKVEGLPKADPWKPVDWRIEDAYAIQAVAHGRASEDQQRRAMKFLVEALCGTYDLSYRASDRDTVFAEGKRFVGLQLVKFIQMNLSHFKERGGEKAPTEQGI